MPGTTGIRVGDPPSIVDGLVQELRHPLLAVLAPLAQLAVDQVAFV